MDVKRQSVAKDVVDALLRETLIEFSFSLFPYVHGYNSYQAQRFKQGDCVAMCLYLQQKLKKRKIYSVLVPATIPKRYELPGLLKISHVALAVWSGTNRVFLCDPAFYFCESMEIKLDSSESGRIISANVYSNINETLVYSAHFHRKRIEVNRYQSIHANTYSVDTYSTDHPTDFWQYFLIEVLNPDEAITTFYMNVKKYPFIAKVDSDLRLEFYLRFYDSFHFIIDVYGERLFKGSLDELPARFKPLIAKHFGRDWIKILQFPIRRHLYFIQKNKTRKRRI